MRNAESRLVRLEEKAYFQERTIEALNEALALQQKQIDALERSLAATARRLEAMILALEENRRHPGLEIPPHYQPKPEL